MINIVENFSKSKKNINSVQPIIQCFSDFIYYSTYWHMIRFPLW